MRSRLLRYSRLRKAVREVKGLRYFTVSPDSPLTMSYVLREVKVMLDDYARRSHADHGHEGDYFTCDLHQCRAFKEEIMEGVH